MNINFNVLVKHILSEMNVSGGVDSVFGQNVTKSENAFSGDKYNPGSAIIANILGGKVSKRKFPELITKPKSKKNRKKI